MCEKVSQHTMEIYGAMGQMGQTTKRISQISSLFSLNINMINEKQM